MYRKYFSYYMLYEYSLKCRVKKKLAFFSALSDTINHSMRYHFLLEENCGNTSSNKKHNKALCIEKNKKKNLILVYRNCFWVCNINIIGQFGTNCKL